VQNDECHEQLSGRENPEDVAQLARISRIQVIGRESATSDTRGILIL
jgi:hypothetical protein